MASGVSRSLAAARPPGLGNREGVPECRVGEVPAGEPQPPGAGDPFPNLPKDVKPLGTARAPGRKTRLSLAPPRHGRSEGPPSLPGSGPLVPRRSCLGRSPIASTRPAPGNGDSRGPWTSMPPSVFEGVEPGAPGTRKRRVESIRAGCDRKAVTQGGETGIRRQGIPRRLKRGDPSLAAERNGGRSRSPTHARDACGSGLSSDAGSRPGQSAPGRGSLRTACPRGGL